ncbi:MAG: hypothetical protein JWP61_1067, partial [Friedmanniella sp.]|nr:hypothetical protein [Friedmanniella sp.]
MGTYVRRTARLGLAALLLVAAGLLNPGTAAAATWDPGLARYPYLTDVTTTSVQVTWADTYKSTDGAVTWGPAGGSCTASSAAAGRLGTAFTVAGTAEYQHSVTLTGLSPGTAYCYRVTGGKSNSVDLLGADPSPTFRTLPSTGAYSFLTFGDWGDTTTGPNPDQAELHSLMASSGALFAVGTGDIAYPSGTQTQYGDLLNTGTGVSEVFGPDFWRRPGPVLPFFSTPGNHGRTTTFFQTWPQPAVAADTGESYGLASYPASTALGYSASTGPAAWYAFDVAGTRYYVLTADWSDNNTGTADGALCQAQFASHACPDYQAEQDAHWKPGRPEYEWLKADLATHPGLKLAFFHYPLRSDDATEPGDPYLQDASINPDRASSLERLLVSRGVKLAFNGHAHIYQRNVAPPGGLVSYVTGGGGAALAPIARGSGASCSPTNAYGLGWSSTGGSYCGAAGAKPVSASKVFHFLKVTVDGTTVTVTPTNADGETFDSVTYDFGADSTAPTAPGSVQTALGTAANPAAKVTWTPGSDAGSGVAAYDVYRQDPGAGSRVYLATVAPDKTGYTDTTAVFGTAYTYSVDTRDQAGNTATRTDAAVVPEGTTTVLTATEDTTIDASLPDKNLGAGTKLLVDGSPVNRALVKFTVPAGCGTVQSAHLSLTVGTSIDDKAGKGGDVHPAGNGWSGSTATWNNTTGVVGDAVVASFPGTSPGVELGQTYTVDVSSAVTGEGPVSLAVVSTSADAARYLSTEGATTADQTPTLTVVCDSTPASGATSTFAPTADSRVEQANPT